MNARKVWGVPVLLAACLAVGIWMLRDSGGGRSGDGHGIADTGTTTQDDPPELRGVTPEGTAHGGATPAGRVGDAGDHTRGGDNSGRALLVAKVLDDANAPVRDVRVVVVPHAAGAEEQARPSAETDADGVGRMPVPARCYPLQLVVLDRGWRVGAVTLDAPEKQVQITIGRAMTCSIVVRDQLGLPVEGALVRFRPSGQVSASPGEARPLSQTTDAQGLAIMPGSLRQSMLGDLEVLSTQASGEFTGSTEKAWVPVTRTEVTVDRWARITGRVVSDGGEPASKATVFMRAGEDVTLHATDAGGGFTIRSRAGVSVQLAARPGEARSVESWSAPDVRRVVAPAEGVVLEVEAGNILRVEVDGVRAEMNLQCSVIREPDRIERIAKVVDGACAFRGLDPGAIFSIWIHGASGEYAHVRGIAGSAGSVRVALQQGRTLEFDLAAPDGWSVRDVSLFDRGIHVRGKRLGKQRFFIGGLPPGNFRVVVLLMSKEGMREVEITTDDIDGTQEPIELRLGADK